MNAILGGGPAPSRSVVGADDVADTCLLRSATRVVAGSGAFEVGNLSPAGCQSRGVNPSIAVRLPKAGSDSRRSIRSKPHRSPSGHRGWVRPSTGTREVLERGGPTVEGRIDACGVGEYSPSVGRMSLTRSSVTVDRSAAARRRDYAPRTTAMRVDHASRFGRDPVARAQRAGHGLGDGLGHGLGQGTGNSGDPSRLP